MDAIERLTETLRAELPGIADAARRAVATAAGLAHDPEAIRLTKAELHEAVSRRALGLVPSDAAAVVVFLAADPKLLESEISTGDRSMTLVEAVGSEIAERMVAALSIDTYRLVHGQFGAPDFARAIEGIRSTLPNVAKADAAAAEALDAACDRQTSQRRPTSRSLLEPIGRARRALADRRRQPAPEYLADARALLEIAFFIDATGYRLDKTHVPTEASAPKP